MRELTTGLVVIAIAALLLVPIGFLERLDPAGGEASNGQADTVASAESIVFPSPVNTSQTVPEYSMVSRAVMLAGGTTYSTLSDINRDGRSDLIVAVSEAKAISVFYRQSDGTFLTHPSMNISLDRVPIGVVGVDAFAKGVSQIAVIERRIDDLDAERLLIYNYTSESTAFTESRNISLYKTAASFAVGYLNGDMYPDFAFVCPGLNPAFDSGVAEIRFGPDYTTSILFSVGKGSNSVAVGNFSPDNLQDLAISDYYDKNVLVFFQPFSFGSTPSYTLTTSVSTPLALASADLNSDDTDDLAVVAASPSRLLFYFQSMGSLQTAPDATYSRVLTNETASYVSSRDVNGDGRNDLVMLSAELNRAFGITQRSSVPIWPEAYDFAFPTGENPRHALVGDLDSDSLPDIAVSSARSDWTGSSLAIYPARTPIVPAFSNANTTIWGNSSSRVTSIGVGDIDGDDLGDVAFLYDSASMLGVIDQPTGIEHDTALGFSPKQMIVSELNGDACSDILVLEGSGNHMSLFFGQSDLSSPLQSTEIQCSSNITDFAVGFLNDDELVDVVAVTVNGTVDIFFNTGNSIDPFSAAYEMAVAPGTSIPAVTVGDFNSDERDDIAYSLPSLYINISFQKEASPFFESEADVTLFHTTGGIFTYLWSGDMDGDSKTDIAAMKASDSVVSLFDQRNFTTTRASYRELGLPAVPEFISVSDFTDDGHADVAVTFDSADLLFLYRQSLGGIPPEPSMVFVTGASPNYAAVGTIGQDTVQSLIVSDSKSHSLSVWRQINHAPVAEAGGPYSAMEGAAVNIVASATDSISQLPRMMYRWTFGDGNFTDWQSSPTTTHNYTQNGSYDLLLEVRDPGGKVANDTAVVNIVDSVPQVDFDWSPLTPVEGQDIVFVDKSWSYDAIVLINWSINAQIVDSGTAHSITKALQDGNYSVTLEEHDNDGSIGSLTKNLTVLRSPPQITIIAPLSATEDDEVNFTVQLDPWHSGLGDTVQSYEWDFSFNGTFVPDAITTSNQTTHAFYTATDVVVFTVAVNVTDNDGDHAMGFFNITIFDRTKVSILMTTQGPSYEFDLVNFTAVVDSPHPATLFEWQFEAVDASHFNPDEFRSDNASISHVYGKSGTFLLLVRATVSNGSTAIGWLYVTILDIVPTGVFEDYVTWHRNPANTSEITFDAAPLASKYPDISQTTWEFGDGTNKLVFGGPVSAVVHYYVPDKNYLFELIVTDDELNTLTLTTTLKLNAPKVILISPSGDSVISAGVPVRFLISDDTLPLASAKYTVNGGQPSNFTSEWEVPTSGWSDGFYTIAVTAIDVDGNVAVVENISIVIDDLPPVLEVLWNVTSIYGGRSINVSIKVTDPHLDRSSIFLYVKFPGAKSYSQVYMNSAGNGVYFAVVEVPKRSGTLMFRVSVADLAQNPTSSGLYSVEVKLHFIDWAWPFLLGLAILAAFGTTGYFFREAKIAVDETFVIYNDGRMISHSTRHLKPDMDDQVLSSMLVAIQDFVKESFKDVTSYTLRRLEFGEKSVLIEKGERLFLAVILHGKVSKKVAARMQSIVDEIEKKFYFQLQEWDGDLESLRGVGDIAKKLYSKAPLLPPFLRHNT